MAGGRTPANQRDALPIQSVAQWLGGNTTTPGTIQVFGASVTKFFAPTDTGINGVMTAGAGGWDGATASFIRGVSLDLTGCRSFVAVIARTMAINQNEVAQQSLSLYAEFNDSLGNYQPAPFPSIAWAMGIKTVTLVAQVNAAGEQIVAIGWANGDATGIGNMPYIVTLGTNVRFFIGSNVNAAAFAIPPTYALSLWASSD